MRCVVIGAKGQLGRDLVSRLTGEVIPLSRAELDLSQPGPLETVLATHRPTHVVNCAAYNLVDKAESEPETAFSVNAWAVRHLAQACVAINAHFVHFSTDYVFGQDETRTQPYLENDAPGPVSVYGLSKLCGEYHAAMVQRDVLILRTCGLFGVWGSGGKGGNFLETMLKHAAAGRPLRVVNDQYCTPSYTVDVAEAAIALLQSEATGLYHVVNSGSCTWYELAAELFRQQGITADLAPIPTAGYPTPARRPGYSVLSTQKLFEAGVAPRSWQQAVTAYLQERAQKAAKDSATT